MITHFLLKKKWRPILEFNEFLRTHHRLKMSKKLNIILKNGE